MAASLIGGIIAGGHDPAGVLLFEPDQAKARTLVDQFGIVSVDSNHTLVARSQTIVVAVKPQMLERVLVPLREDFQQSQPLLISVVAGIPAASINKWLDGDYAVIRVMPNTPALIGAGASGMHANHKVSDAQKDFASQLLSTVGVSAWVPNEQDIDSVTALSGSGPAYFMLFIQALINAAQQAGLQADTAKLLAVATAKGAAQLIESSELDLKTLIDNVTSPNGTTEQALKTFAEHQLTGTVQAAFDAAKQRSIELAEELG